MNIYQLHIMEHYRNPKNKGICEAATFNSEVLNPSCGDAVRMTGIIDNKRLVRVCFDGHGCVISQAAASMLTEKVTGMSCIEVRALATHDMTSLVGIQLGPTRVRCALLALEALQKGLASCLTDQN